MSLLRSGCKSGVSRYPWFRCWKSDCKSAAAQATELALLMVLPGQKLSSSSP